MTPLVTRTAWSLATLHPPRLVPIILLCLACLSAPAQTHTETREAAQLIDSSNTEARLGLAEAQIQQSNFADAVPDLEALTKSDPRNGAALRLLARAYRGAGREQDARQAENKAAALEKK